jgi:hypothetical protein
MGHHHVEDDHVGTVGEHRPQRLIARPAGDAVVTGALEAADGDVDELGVVIHDEHPSLPWHGPSMLVGT